jgi:hypothetical protein
MKAMMETDVRTAVGPRIQVVRREIDLGDSQPGFRDLEEINWRTVQSFSEEGSSDHFYSNPECSIRASCILSEREFLIAAEKACGRWIQRLRKTFGRGRLDRMLRSLAHDQRLLVASGVLFLNGTFVHPKRLNWRASSQQAPR